MCHSRENGASWRRWGESAGGNETGHPVVGGRRRGGDVVVRATQLRYQPLWEWPNFGRNRPSGRVFVGLEVELPYRRENGALWRRWGEIGGSVRKPAAPSPGRPTSSSG